MLGEDASKYSTEEKLEILKAYMEGGGVQGLIDGEDDEEMDEMEIRMVEEAFDEMWKSDANLRKLLGEHVHAMGPKEKKQILLEINEKGGVNGLLEDDNEPSFVMHNGKRYDRVQIEEDQNEYLMDEEGNLYSTNFEFIGHANPSDTE